MAEYSWFKFDPGKWLIGTVQDLSPEGQGAFINFLCIYWTKDCKVTVTTAKVRSRGFYDEFLEKGLIKVKENGDVSISWLDHHLAGLKGKSAQLSENAQKRWRDANAMQMQCKSNAEREKERKKDRFNPPTPLELENYFFERLGNKSLSQTEAEKFMNHYTSNGWMVGKNKMKDWKASVRNWEKNIKIPIKKTKRWQDG